MYGAVANTIRYLADRSEQPRPETIAVAYGFPLTHAQILDIFRAKLREVKQQRPNIAFTDAAPLSPGAMRCTRGGTKSLRSPTRSLRT